MHAGRPAHVKVVAARPTRLLPIQFWITPKVRSPRTNGFVERMNRTLLDECFRVQGRQTWYIGVDEIQRDLDRFLRYYNLERSHQGYRLKGRTPAQALMEALAVTEIPDIIPAEEVNEPLPTAA